MIVTQNGAKMIIYQMAAYVGDKIIPSSLAYHTNNLVFPKWICQIKQICQILLKCLLFTQNTSNLVQNIHNFDLKHSGMKFKKI